MEGASVFIIFVVFIVIGFLLNTARKESHQEKIHSQIESMGGKVITIEKRSFFTGLGPFAVVGKGRVVYRIEYEADNETKEGWVRFGGIMGPDWKL